MAIAFNLPSEREAAEENFSRLNRLLAELYEVLCHILVARQPSPDSQEQRRDRPFSDSDIDRATVPDLPALARPISTSQLGQSTSLTLPLNLDYDDDDVFVSPRTDNGSDPFTDPRNVEIFGRPRGGHPRTPAGVLLSSRRERLFNFSVNSEKYWLDKGGTDEADGIRRKDSDETDATASQESGSTSSDNSIFSSIIPDKLSGSICTALLFMLGWKLFTNKR